MIFSHNIILKLCFVWLCQVLQFIFAQIWWVVSLRLWCNDTHFLKWFMEYCFRGGGLSVGSELMNKVSFLKLLFFSGNDVVHVSQSTFMTLLSCITYRILSGSHQTKMQDVLSNYLGWNILAISVRFRWNKMDPFRMWFATGSVWLAACICEWLQGGARLPTTHTHVKLTLCNGCYLITENSRGKKSGQSMLRGKTGSAAVATWLRKLLSSCFDLPSLC